MDPDDVVKSIKELVANGFAQKGKVLKLDFKRNYLLF